MGISVEMFVKTYKANSKAKDKTFEDFINKHITTSYVDFVTKKTYCDLIIKSSCYQEDGDREFVKIDSATRYMFFVMRLISLYTDIEINDVVKEYDELNKVGAIETLISAIPEKEYLEFSNLLNMRMDDFIDNEYSLTALFYNLKQSFSLSDEVFSEVLNSPEIQKAIKNAVDNKE